MWDVLGSCVCEWRVGETCLVLLPGHHDGAVVDAHNVDLVDPSLLKPAVKLGSLEARDLVEGGGGGGSWTGSTSLGSMGRASIPTLNNSSKERHLGRGWEAEGANTNRRWKGRGGGRGGRTRQMGKPLEWILLTQNIITPPKPTPHAPPLTPPLFSVSLTWHVDHVGVNAPGSVTKRTFLLSPSMSPTVLIAEGVLPPKPSWCTTGAVGNLSPTATIVLCFLVPQREKQGMGERGFREYGRNTCYVL